MGLAATAFHGWNFMFLQIKVLELSFRTGEACSRPRETSCGIDSKLSVRTAETTGSRRWLSMAALRKMWTPGEYRALEAIPKNPAAGLPGALCSRKPLPSPCRQRCKQPCLTVPAVRPEKRAVCPSASWPGCCRLVLVFRSRCVNTFKGVVCLAQSRESCIEMIVRWPIGSN